MDDHAVVCRVYCCLTICALQWLQLIMASAPSSGEINDKELRDSFAKIDTDRSGKISRAEIAAFFRRHGSFVCLP